MSNLSLVFWTDYYQQRQVVCINHLAGPAQSAPMIATAPRTSRSSNGSRSRIISDSPQHNLLATSLASIRPVGLLYSVLPTDSAIIIGHSVYLGTTWALRDWGVG